MLSFILCYDFVLTLHCHLFVFLEPCDGFKGYNLQSDKCHEAGYDAFLTGFSYVGLVSKLGKYLFILFYIYYYPEKKSLVFIVKISSKLSIYSCVAFKK